MLETIQTQHILFIDIETVSICKDYSDLSETFQTLWDKKHQLIDKENVLTPAESFQKNAAIYAEFGKIICISCGYLTKEKDTEILRVKSFSHTNEAILLQQFAEMIQKNYYDPSHHALCGHNIKEFDIPYLCRRMLVNQVPLPYILSLHGKKPWEINHIDTLQLWKFGDYKAYTSLNLLAALFEIPTPKDDIDGSMVGDVFWNKNDTQRIITYCEKDVITVVRLFQRLQGKQIISDEHIQIIH